MINRLHPLCLLEKKLYLANVVAAAFDCSSLSLRVVAAVGALTLSASEPVARWSNLHVISWV